MNKNPLLSFELTKIYKSKLTYVIPLILLIGLVVIYYFTSSNFSTYKSETPASLSLEIESIGNSIKELDNIEKAKPLKETLIEQKKLTQQKLTAFTDSNWEEFTKLQITTDKTLVTLMENGNAHIPVPISEIEKQIGLNEEVLERKVLPVAPGTEVEGIHFTSLIIKLFFNLVGTFILILIICKLFTQEIETGTFKFLTNQPLELKKIFYSKYFLTVSVGTLITLLVMILAFLIGYIFEGTGNLNYPVLITAGEDTYQFISVLEFITKSTILYLLGIVFTCSLVYLISLLTRNSLITFILTLIFILSGTILYQSVEPLLKFAHLNPFFYLNSASIINMDIGEKLSNYNFSFVKGIVLFSLSSFLINITSLKIMKKSSF